MASKRHGYARHGKRTPEYRSWLGARERCQNPNCKDYPRYGGRGIGFDSRWDHFPTFLADMGPRPEGATLDRIDPDGPYSPQNCRWASRKDQARNRVRRSMVRDMIGGAHIKDEADKVGMSYGVLYHRLLKGMDLASALSEPVRFQRERSP